jgi:tetratricopeptide (TPR) repeat protein
LKTGWPQRRSSERTDVYALGAILYEILTGRVPFQEDETRGLLWKIVNEPPVPPRQIAPEVPCPLEAIALRALEKKPDKRYASSEAFVRDLERYLADEPVEAWSEPWLYRLGRWGRRHRTLVASTAAAVGIAILALTAGLIFLGQANARERHLRQVAENEKREADRQRERAERHYRLAREFVDTYLTKVSKDERSKSYGRETLRRDLLDSARSFYDRFVAASEDDLAVRGERAAAYYKLANIESQTGNSARAIELAEKGSKIMAAVLEEKPAFPGIWHDAIEGDQWFAHFVGMTGNINRSEEIFRRSQDRVTQARESHPEDRKLRELQISGLLSRGSIRLMRQQLAPAMSDFETAQQELEKLRQREGDTEWILSQQYFAGSFLGTSALARQEISKAKDQFEKAAPVLQKLQKLKPNDPELKNSHADLLIRQANVKHLTNHPDDTANLYNQALAIVKALVDEHPKITAFRLKLGGLSVSLGQVAAKNGQFDEAMKHFNRAVAVLLSPASDRSTSHESL